MTFEIEYESILSRELHIKIHDVTEMPIVIRDPMITELHTVVNNNSIQTLIGSDPRKNFGVEPYEAQASDWIWETSKGELRFTGVINKQFTPCEIDLWLIG